MSSDRKIKANQRNARASTGPKTSAGRARVARNAVRHGLNVPLMSDPTLIERVKALARKIAGPAAQPLLQELAMQLAEAQVELQRARSARHRVISAALNRIETKCARAERGLDEKAPHDAQVTALQDAQRCIDPWEQSTQQLLALDRYLRHANSQRKRAIRALELCPQWDTSKKYQC